MLSLISRIILAAYFLKSKQINPLVNIALRSSYHLMWMKWTSRSMTFGHGLNAAENVFMDFTIDTISLVNISKLRLSSKYDYVIGWKFCLGKTVHFNYLVSSYYAGHRQ